MRAQWYGDVRDVGKWSALIHLARLESAPAILHVAMCRPDDAPPALATAYGHVPLPEDVLRHFWNLEDLRRLSASTGIAIDIHDDLFTHRAAYFGGVCRRIQGLETPALVFLDPDIGLESETPGPPVVTSAEVALLFDALRSGDILVCYQHARRQKGWRGRARRAFANAPGLPSFDVEILESKLANDVLLLAVKKP